MDDKFYVGRVTVGKRPNKRGYYAYYRDSAGRQHNKSLRTNNKKEAKDRAQRIADTIEAGTDLRVERVRENRGVTVSDAIPTVIKLVKWDGRYRDECIKILHQFEAQYGDRSMAFITQADINEYLVAVLQRTSRATHNRHKSALRGFFQAAHSKDLVAQDPTTNVGHLEEPENVPDALTEKQFGRVLNALPEHAQIIMQILHDTGMRSGELHSLPWRNIRSDKRIIVVEDTKNNQFRMIPMTDAVYALFERLRQEGHHPLKRNGSRVPFKSRWPDDTDPDAVAIPATDITRLLKEAAKKVGLSNLTRHMMRHTFATFLGANGATTLDLQDLGGWKTDKMVRRYRKVVDDRLHEVMEAFNQHQPHQTTGENA